MKWLSLNSLIYKIGKARLPAPFLRWCGFPIYLRGFSGAVLGALSPFAWSLGLGDLQATSYVGQPLQASIQLLSVDPMIDPDSLVIRRISAAEAERIGVEVFYNANDFDFTLGRNADNKLSVQVVSAQPIKEPFFNLVVELRWSTGVVYRDYAVLLDLPPAAFAREPAPSQVAAETAIPHAPQKPSPAVRAMTLPPLTTADGQYRVAPGDTLSTISARWREGTDQSLADTTAWLFENNPSAFVNNDINRLRAGAVLQMPDLAAYRRGQELTRAAGGGTAAPPAATVRPVAAEPDGQPSRESRGPATDAAMVADSRGMLTVGAETQDDRTRELIDMLTRENEFLRARMERIESSEYLDTVKSLVLLQRQQISELRAQLGVAESAAAVEVERLLADLGLSEVERQQVEQSVAKLNAPAAQQLVDPVVDAVPEASAGRTLEVSAMAMERPGIAVPESLNRGWLFSALLAAGILLSVAFTAMFAYYRRMVPGIREENKHSDRARMEMPEKGQSFKVGNDSDHHCIDYPKTAESSAQRVRPEVSLNWLGEQVEVDDFDESGEELFTSEEYPAFENLRLDEAALQMTVEETDLDTVKAETGAPLQSAPVQHPIEAPEAPESHAESKIERRPDDEVRVSIAEKTAQYDPEHFREELENLVLLELDELDLDISDGDDAIDTLVSQAKMYCEFKKFTKARELIESRLTESEDVRLNAALEEVDSMMEMAEEKS